MAIKLFLLLLFTASVLADNTWLFNCANSYYGCCNDGKTERIAVGEVNKQFVCAYAANDEQLKCQQSKFGCCWDRKTPAKGYDKIHGCPWCRDNSHFYCKRYAGRCTTETAPLSRAFMRDHCAKTCGICP